jgi:hypothetical protein
VQTAAVVTRGIASFGDDKVTLDTLNLRLNSTLSSNILNEARFQYSRDLEQQVAQQPAPGEPTTANGFSPSVAIGTGGFTFGKPNFLDRAAYPDEKRWQFANSTTIIQGRHTVKFGGDFNHVSDLLDNLFQNAGAYSYSNIVEFLSVAFGCDSFALCLALFFVKPELIGKCFLFLLQLVFDCRLDLLG